MTTQTLPPPPVNAGRNSYALEDSSGATYVGIVIDDTATTVTVSAPRSEVMRPEFRALADWWHEATGHLSDPDRIAAHPALKRIIELGHHNRADILRYALEDLKSRGGHWYAGLRELAGESPVPPNHRGNIRLMKQDWLQWARKRDIIS